MSPRLPTPREKLDFTLDDYHQAPSGRGPLAHEWANKPHRLLYDLLGYIQYLEGQQAEEDK